MSALSPQITAIRQSLQIRALFVARLERILTTEPGNPTNDDPGMKARALNALETLCSKPSASFVEIAFWLTTEIPGTDTPQTQTLAIGLYQRFREIEASL
jgi:hypothetical protein